MWLFEIKFGILFPNTFYFQPSTNNRLGNIFIPFFDKWTSSFCRTFGAADQTIFPRIQFADESPFYHILHDGASRYLKIIGDKGLATPDIQYLTPSQVGGIRSHATSPGKSPGEHTMANGEVSMSSKERMANARAALTIEDCRNRMLVRPMNGTAHLNPNAEEDFIHHCAMAKKLFEQVSRYYLLLTIKQLY